MNCAPSFWLRRGGFAVKRPKMDFRLTRKETQLQTAAARNGSLPQGRGSAAGGYVRAAALFLLKCYKRFISPFLPHACRFEPTCSVYMYQAIQKKGLLKGILLGIKRLARCHPFCEGGIDPVP